MAVKANTTESVASAAPDYDVIVVGAGFAGMYAIHRFRQLGVRLRVFEAGTDVGGTWYWNRYPGARCDVPSLEYSYGFSRELEREWNWPEVFSAQPDILRYANHVADRFDLRRDIEFNTRINAVTYDEDANVWTVTTEQGSQHTATYCVMATGCLSVPNKPDLPGGDTFAGQELHTGLWPKEEVDLSGKRVGVIGTGSSGVQAIPELARMSGHLTVFQRTPVYTVPANRKRMRADVQDEFREYYPEIRELQQNNQGGVSNYRPGHRHLAVKEGHEGRLRTARPKEILPLTPEERQDAIDRNGLGEILTFRDVYTDAEANEIANELFRVNLAQLIDDPDVADKLMPTDYGLGCKRQVIDRDYYDTFNRDDVELIDLKSEPLVTINPDGIQTEAGQYDVDVLVYATGFDAMTGALLKANITGRGGRTLAQKWEYGPQAFLGLQVAGFPNLFTVTGPGSPSVLCNMLVAIEQHVNWIADAIDYLRDSGYTRMETTEASELEWIAHVNDVADGTMYTSPSCNSWYLGANIDGKPRIFMPYVGGYPRYRERCEAIAANDYEGFALS